MHKNSVKICIQFNWLFFSFRVQDTDGQYFESFTALAWKQENQRQTVLKAAETVAADPPPHEGDLGIVAMDYTIHQNEKDKLYVEMLYTIANAVSSSPLDLIHFPPRFRFPRHYILNHRVSGAKTRI